jgi:hypothetical protein
MSATKKGWVNLHINVLTNEVFASKHPYKTEKEAETGIFIGYGIEKVGCFEIEYQDVSPAPAIPEPTKKELTDLN